VSAAEASDEQLVASAKAGDRRALDALLRRHYDRVHAVCARIAGATRDADDAAQEAMIRIVRSLDRFDGRSAFGTWAYRIATNAALDELRKRQRRPQLHIVDDDAPDAVPHQAPADELAHRQVDAVADRLAIEAALAELPEDFRIPVVMRDVGDLDYAEIAVELGVPIGTVKSRIARGRRMLVERLGNQADGPERPNRHQPPAERPGTDPPNHP
jgi:RNA polymerase sigma-70 factor (ECF subfamily)